MAVIVNTSCIELNEHFKIMDYTMERTGHEEKNNFTAI